MCYNWHLKISVKLGLYNLKVLTTPNDHTSHFALTSFRNASGGMYAGVPLQAIVQVDSMSSPETASLRSPKSATWLIQIRLFWYLIANMKLFNIKRVISYNQLQNNTFGVILSSNRMLENLISQWINIFVGSVCRRWI